MLVMGALEARAEAIGQGRRHELLPPIHAVRIDGGSMALCGVEVREVFLNAAWDDESQTYKRCGRCVDLAAEGPMPEVEVFDTPFYR